MRGGWRRLAALVAFGGVVVLARVATSAVVDLRAARAAETEGRAHEAAVRYGDAIRMHVPLLPTGDRASEGLVRLAEGAEGRGERDEARFCWEELRSSWLAVRSTVQPGSGWIALAEERIAASILADPRGVWPDGALPTAERRRVVEAAIAAREDPSLPWVLALALGYVLWLGGAALAIWRGLPERDDAPLALRPLVRFGALSLAGYALLLLSLARA